MTRNGKKPQSYKGDYSPDVTGSKALGFLKEALEAKDGRSWFVVHAPVAPHSNFAFAPDAEKQESDAPRYAERHAHLFKDYKIPRNADFNPEKQGGVGWISRLPRLNQTVVEYNDEFQRARLRALQSVDESLEQLVRKIEDAGELENTYIFYTTDNGYHISQKRLHPGKECGFDTDINIPLVVRGPGVPAGLVSTGVSSHTDIASTILGIAGVQVDGYVSDDSPIPITAQHRHDQQKADTDHSHASRGDRVNIDFWGLGIPEGKYGSYGDEKMNDGQGFKAHAMGNNTYKGLRIVNEAYSLYYVVWCTNEHELYDLSRDPYQIHNLLSADGSSLRSGDEDGKEEMVLGRPLKELVNRLDALLLVLKSCKGRTCTHPWEALHPSSPSHSTASSQRHDQLDQQSALPHTQHDNVVQQHLGVEHEVYNLQDSLDPRYDAFYAHQPKVGFSRCELGYIRDAEGPLVHRRYDSWLHGQYSAGVDDGSSLDRYGREGREGGEREVRGDAAGNAAFIGPVESREMARREGWPVGFSVYGPGCDVDLISYQAEPVWQPSTYAEKRTSVD